MPRSLNSCARSKKAALKKVFDLTPAAGEYWSRVNRPPHELPLKPATSRPNIAMGVVLFFLGKVAIYTFWCWYGVRLLAPTRRNFAAPIALGLAILRIVVGLVLGFAWGFAASYVAPNEELSRVGFDPFVFVIGFLFLRLIQWSGISWLITWGTEQQFLLLTGVKDWLWRLGGVGISFLGDIFGLILYLGFVGIVC